MQLITLSLFLLFPLRLYSLLILHPHNILIVLKSHLESGFKISFYILNKPLSVMVAFWSSDLRGMFLLFS